MLGGWEGRRWREGAGGSLLFLPLNQKVYEYFGMPAVGILKKNRAGGNIGGENRDERCRQLPPAPSPTPLHPPPHLTNSFQPPDSLQPRSPIRGRNRATIAAPVVESTSRLIKMKWAADSQGAF